jgi:uncharacterized membrane protein YoaK (UPF0700 family)
MRRVTDSHLRDVLLVALTLSMGSIDAVSWLGLGKVYSAFQTGNIVVLGFGVAGAAGPPVMRAAVSLVSFGLGALIASELVRRHIVGDLWPRRVSVVLTGVGVTQVAFLALWLAVHGHPASSSADVLIGLGALAAGMQTGAIFSLGIRAVFTSAATATWTAIMSDLARGSRAPADLGRLLAVVVGAFAGAVAGGALMLHARHLAPVLAPALTVAVVATAELVLGRRAPAASADRLPTKIVGAS